MAADYSRIHRLLRILTLIQSEPGWNPRRLSVECATTERNVYRDIRIIRAAGIPVDNDPEKHGYVVRKDFFLPAVTLSLDESLALVALAEHIGGKEQIPMMSAAAKAIAKIRCNLPPKIQQELADIDPYLNIQLPPVNKLDGIRDVYLKMQMALKSKRAMLCEYEAVSHQGDGDNFAGTFEFEPYTLFFSQRAWYAVGYHCGRRGLRCLKLNRFSRCQITDRTYKIPKTFSLDKHLGNAWRMIRGKTRYDVELWFDPSFAETIDDTYWHKTQEVQWQPDGSIVFQASVDGLEEILWWILSMGPHCIVRKPKELAERVKELAEKMAECYPADGEPAKASRIRKVKVNV